jgi:hypothetical protein
MVPAFTPLARAQARPRTPFGAITCRTARSRAVDPEVVGADSTKSRSSPLEPFKDQMVVVANLTRSHPGSRVGDHAVSAAASDRRLAKRTEAEDVLASTTIDQVVARQIGQDTAFRAQSPPKISPATSGPARPGSTAY